MYLTSGLSGCSFQQYVRDVLFSSVVFHKSLCFAASRLWISKWKLCAWPLLLKDYLASVKNGNPSILPVVWTLKVAAHLFGWTTLLHFHFLLEVTRAVIHLAIWNLDVCCLKVVSIGLHVFELFHFSKTVTGHMSKEEKNLWKQEIPPTSARLKQSNADPGWYPTLKLR